MVYFTFRQRESFTTDQLLCYSPWISNKGAWELHFETLSWWSGQVGGREGGEVKAVGCTAHGCLLLRSHSSVTCGRLATSQMRLRPLATLDHTCNNVIELRPCFVCSRFGAANKSSSVYLKLENPNHQTQPRLPGDQRRRVWMLARCHDRYI